jgi:carbon monoxide dehydrogenase subunit G
VVEVTASTTVPAPPEQVWELTCDTTRYAEWVVGTDQVTRTDGPAREGSTYDEKNTIVGPWKARTSWRVTEFDAPRRQVHVSNDVPLAREFLVIMEVTPEGDGSRVTFTLGAEMKGPLGGLFAKAMRPGVARDNRRTVAQFAELARREPAARASA